MKFKVNYKPVDSDSAENFTNPGKQPIHSAVESLSLATLRTILEKDPAAANEKYDDLSPFHILVDGVNNENFSETMAAIKLLVNFDVDINCPALKTTFHTPFSLLLKRMTKLEDDDMKRELLDFLISSYTFIDVDTYREGEARRLLEKYFPDFVDQFPRVVPEDSDVESKDQLLAKLLQVLETDECRFLQNFYALQKDERHQSHFAAIIEEGILFEELVNRGAETSVELMLQLGASVNQMSRSSTYTPIGVTCQRGYWKIMKLLASQPGALLNNKNNPLLHIVVKHLELESTSPLSDYRKCFDFLLEHPRIDINEQDASGNTALHYAVRYKNEYAMKKLLDRSAYLGATNIFKVLAVRDIPPELLEAYFDTCITTNSERSGDDDYEIRIDYSCLVPPQLQMAREGSQSSTFEKELLPVQCLAETAELRHLVQHPVITSFLYLKWFRLSPIFYANLLAYAIYCVSMITYIVFYFDGTSGLALVLQALTLLGALYVLIREILQFIVAPWCYTKSPANFLEVGLIVVTWIILCTTFCDDLQPDTKRYVHHVLGSIAIILAAVELSLLVGSLPYFAISTHMVMLKTVSLSFLRGLAVYSIILVAFAFSFYTLFSGDGEKGNGEDDELNKFLDPGRAIVKTIVMLTGEFEASSIDFDQNAMSYLIFVLFLFFMSIVVLNLLNGLAVSDTQLIKSEAELNNWLERIQLLVSYENNLLGRSAIAQWEFLKKGAAIISMFPEFLPLHIVYIKVNQHPANQILIPITVQKCGSGESGDVNSLITNSDSGNVRNLDAPVQVLFCCFVWKNCAVMDRKIVKLAKRLLALKERRQAEAQEKNEMMEQIKKIDKKLNHILDIVHSL